MSNKPSKRLVAPRTISSLVSRYTDRIISALQLLYTLILLQFAQQILTLRTE